MSPLPLPVSEFCGLTSDACFCHVSVRPCSLQAHAFFHLPLSTWEAHVQVPTRTPSVSRDVSLTASHSLLCVQRFVTSWWSSSDVWSSSQSPVSSCCRTCRTSSAARPSCSWSTPGAWTSWPSATRPRYARRGSTSSSSE